MQTLLSVLIFDCGIQFDINRPGFLRLKAYAGKEILLLKVM